MYHLLYDIVIVLSLFLSPFKYKDGEKRERTVQKVTDFDQSMRMGKS